MQENEKLEVVVLPSWAEAFSQMFLMLQKKYPFLGNPRITYSDQNDSNRAKLEIPLSGNDTLLVSCRGKNEVEAAFFFYLATVTQGDNFTLEHHESECKLGLVPGGDELYGDAMNHVLGNELRKLLMEYVRYRKLVVPENT
jgi:hypothetical protein